MCYHVNTTVRRSRDPAIIKFLLVHASDIIATVTIAEVVHYDFGERATAMAFAYLERSL